MLGTEKAKVELLFDIQLSRASVASRVGLMCQHYPASYKLAIRATWDAGDAEAICGPAHTALALPELAVQYFNNTESIAAVGRR